MTMLTRNTWVGIALVCQLLPLLPASSQNRQPRATDAVGIARHIRATGRSGQAPNVLRQRWGPQPAPLLNAVADSLVAIAVAFGKASDNGRTSQEAASTAISSFLLAGASEGDGVPYRGAAVRLGKIVADGDVGVTGGAVFALTRIDDRRAGLAELARIARFPDNPAAYTAVHFLARQTGPEGLEALRLAWRRGEITQPLALRLVQSVAWHAGWSRP